MNIINTCFGSIFVFNHFTQCDRYTNRFQLNTDMNGNSKARHIVVTMNETKTNTCQWHDFDWICKRNINAIETGSYFANCKQLSVECWINSIANESSHFSFISINYYSYVVCDTVILFLTELCFCFFALKAFTQIVFKDLPKLDWTTFADACILVKRARFMENSLICSVR